VRWGTTAAQETIVSTVADLGDVVAARRLRPPAVVVVGEVVRLRERLCWLEARPLFGRRIVVTRARAQASEFTGRLEALGAEVIEFPTIEVVPPTSYAALDAALGRLGDYQWVVFTSVNGVRAFLERLAAVGRDTRDLGGTRLAAIGSETARALARAHLRADAVPEEYRAEALAAALGNVSVRGQRILLPRAAGARAVLPDTMRALGAEVDEVETYRTRPPAGATEEVRGLLAGGEVDLLTFASSSTVRNFVDLLGAEGLRVALTRPRRCDGRRVEVGCIGPVTAQTARALGLPVDIQPAEYTIAAFAEAIVRHFGATVS
jgi:uroporphyrinogen III methyltransferase/synthase